MAAMPHLTAAFAGVLALLYILLALLVVRERGRAKVGLGVGEDERLLRAVRIHGNFAEYVPFAVVLLSFVEAHAFRREVVLALGSALVLGRALHAWGLTRSRGRSIQRFWGTALTLTMLAVCAGLLFLPASSTWLK